MEGGGIDAQEDKSYWSKAKVFIKLAVPSSLSMMIMALQETMNLAFLGRSETGAKATVLAGIALGNSS